MPASSTTGIPAWGIALIVGVGGLLAIIVLVGVVIPMCSDGEKSQPVNSSSNTSTPMEEVPPPPQDYNATNSNDSEAIRLEQERANLEKTKAEAERAKAEAMRAREQADLARKLNEDAKHEQAVAVVRRNLAKYYVCQCEITGVTDPPVPSGIQPGQTVYFIRAPTDNRGLFGVLYNGKKMWLWNGDMRGKFIPMSLG